MSEEDGVHLGEVEAGEGVGEADEEDASPPLELGEGGRSLEGVPVEEEGRGASPLRFRLVLLAD